MSGYVDFFGVPLGEPVNALDRKARQWLTQNPIAWSLMLSLAQELAKDGVPFSCKLVHEMLRHKLNVAGIGVKASNSYTTYFARMLCDFDPDLNGKLTGWKRPEVYDALGDLHE